MSSTQPTLSVSKVYADVNLRRPQEYYDYPNQIIEWRQFAGYSCHMRVGRGRYSDVFLSSVDGNEQPCIIKILKPVKLRKIKREIHILRNLFGGPNIVKLLDVLRDPVSEIHALVYEYVPITPYSKIVQTLTIDKAAYYIYQVLKALDHCHSQGVIHRDVKPQNIIINSDTNQVRLIDWGLAEFYLPGTKLNTHVASRHYKGPELLVDFQDYDYSLDIWSLGCMLAGMIFKTEPFFVGSDNFHQLDVITKVLGTDDLIRYLAKYKINLSPQYDSILGVHRKRSWQSFVNPRNEHLATPLAVDLVSKMLVIDHQHRLTARECMEHPFFAEVHQAELSGIPLFPSVTIPPPPAQGPYEDDDESESESEH